MSSYYTRRIAELENRIIEEREVGFKEGEKCGLTKGLAVAEVIRNKALMTVVMSGRKDFDQWATALIAKAKEEQHGK